MKTPIYIDYEQAYPNYLASNELNIYEEDPIDIYTDPLDTAISGAPYLLAPRYYLIIHRPRNQPGPLIKIPLHKNPNSLLKNKIRVALEPSIGWGINGSYIVEYWEWYPNVNLAAFPSKKLVRKEAWYVPTIDPDTFVPTFPFDIRLNEWYPKTVYYEPVEAPRLVTRNISVSRVNNVGTVSDTINTAEDSDIFCFVEGDFISFTQNVVTAALNFNAETLTWTFDKELVTSTLERDSTQVDGNIATGVTDTTITFIKPFCPDQIICMDYHDILNDGLSDVYTR